MRLFGRSSRGSPLNRYFLPLEDELLSTRMHPRILLAPAGLVLAGLITAALLNIVLSGNGYAIDAIWLIWALLMLWLILKIAYWFTTWYAVTSYRLLRAKGLVVRRVWMMPLKRITSMTVQRPAKTRHFDYGKLATTIDHDQRLSKEWSIEFIPHPDKIYAEIRKALFPDWDIGGD
jgi:membrane protein YdbS with pleckstrin-like domain